MRLDRQRPPIKLHRRDGGRNASRGYRVGPHPSWGDIPKAGEFIVESETSDADTRTVVFKTNECSMHPAAWDFGDGSPVVHIPSYDKIYRTYAADGIYNVVTTCHGQTATVVVTVGNPATLTSLSPTTVTHNQTFTMTLNGSGFEQGASVRYWDGAGTFSGELYIPISVTPTKIVVTVAATGWATGTGGVDVYVGSGPTNQLQFQII